MSRRSLCRATQTLSLVLAWAALSPAPPACAQSGEPSQRLVVDEGTPLRVAVDRRVIVKRVGQPIEAVLIDPVFAYDRIVIPAGTRVVGHVNRRDGVSTKRRMRAMLSGDFTPLHDIGLQFDAIVFADGRRLSVQTQVSPGTERVTLAVAKVLSAVATPSRGRVRKPSTRPSRLPRRSRARVDGSA